MFFSLARRAIGIALVLCSAYAGAAPWIEPGDARLRHHIHVLADAALIRAPVNTWPLMWSGVIADVNRAKAEELTPMQRRAIFYIERAFERQTRNGFELAYAYAEQADPLRGFGDGRREEAEGFVSAEYIGETWAGRLRAANVTDPLDDKPGRFDGSYVAALLGNWAVSVGSLDRWWGPAWESGLILSNNARPVPAITLQRNISTPFEFSWLQWLGPWQFTTFIGQLEEERAVSDARLVGARLDFRPARWLEFGVSRTAQWGGKGRPQDFSSFKNLVLGRDNRGSSGVGIANEPGNQLGGFDWRFSIDAAIPVGIYGEMIGEDEAGYQPSKRIFTLGADAVLPLPESDLRLVLEFSDTATRRFDKGEGEFNLAYEHSIYTSGYRYRGRSLGASIDNDSRNYSLSALWSVSHLQSLRVKVARLELNSDGTGSVIPLGNSFTFGSTQGWYGAASYRWQGRNFDAELGYVHYGGGLTVRRVDTGDDTATLTIRVLL